MLALLLPLLTAQSPDYAASVVALEKAFTASKHPDILLSMAAVYEEWPDHCEEAISVYQRFFDACEQKCVSLTQAIDRFDLLVETCVTSPEDEIAIRERLGVQSRRRTQPKVADASREEVMRLLRMAREVDAEAAGRIYANLIESGSKITVYDLNVLRTRAWNILRIAPPNAEQVHMFVARIRNVDPAGYDLLVAELAARGHDVAALEKIRTLTMEILQEASTPRQTARARGTQQQIDGELVVSAVEGCKANPAYEMGFLTVDSRPWSEIFVNGDRVGTTPVSRTPVVAGCVTVRAINPETGNSKVLNATIRPNRTTIVRVAL